MRHQHIYFTPSEIIQALKHTSLPTILVEGSDDMELFRSIGNECGASILPCGGRENLLEVYKRKTEFDKKSCAFLADRDLWFFEEIPDEFDGIVFTNGYSIENDILYEHAFSRFYCEEDIEEYCVIKEALAVWWAFEVEQKLGGNPSDFDRSIKDILVGLGKKKTKPYIREKYYVDKGIAFSVNPNSERSKCIKENFELAIRGHQLLEIHQYLFRSERVPGTKQLSNGILLMCFQLERSALARQLVDNIKKQLKRFC